MNCTAGSKAVSNLKARSKSSALGSVILLLKSVTLKKFTIFRFHFFRMVILKSIKSWGR